MRYFKSLPNLVNTDYKGNAVVLKNLLVRTELSPKLAKNTLVFYQYAIQEGDTPEIIAHKYYGTPYRFWMVLYGNNQIMNPLTDWPMTSRQFLIYLQNKYKEVAGGVDNVLSYIQGTVHHYEKIVKTIDNNTGTTSIKNLEIDEESFNALMPFKNSQTFPDGSSVTYEMYKQQFSIYEYELNENESKRSINIINSKYTTQLETQYQTLVNM
jgi:hypothetical protein